MCDRRDSISCGPDFAADWAFNGQPQWRMTDKEGVSWDDAGPLNEVGRAAVLRYYHLDKPRVAKKFPLPVVMNMSPDQLEQIAAETVH